MTQPEAASVSVAAPEDTRTGRSAWLVLAAVLPGMFMNVFDFFAVNVATPVLHRDLGSGPPALELIVGGYGLTFSLGLVTGGRLGDRYGRRRVFFAGMAAFTVASALSGLAPTSDILVVARLFQGAAAAMMVPQVLSIIRVSFPARERRIALGVYGMTIAAGQVSGQALGRSSSSTCPWPPLRSSSAFAPSPSPGHRPAPASTWQASPCSPSPPGY
jgi:MFS family permease